MAFEFKLPDLGEGIHEAQVLAWKVAPGQEVKAFQPLCEVESAKAAVELTAPVAGRVVATRFAEGDTAHLGDVLVVIETDGALRPASDEVAPPPGAPASAAPVHESPPADEWFGIVGTPPKQAAAAPPHKRVMAAPFVRKLAKERGIRLEDVHGSGPHGRVRIADLDATTSAATTTGRPITTTTATPISESGAPTVIPLRGMRKAIAEHMVEAWRNAPQVTSMDLLDVTELVRARELLLGAAQDAGARLTYLPLFIKAAIEALRAVPEANARVDDQRSAIMVMSEYHIGIATAIDGGLVVPVVRHADRLSVLDLAHEIDRLVKAARERRTTPAELSGSTFTITSFGGLPGSPLFATPILNYPEAAILGLGRIDLQPRVVDGQLVARQCMGVSFTFDHRVLDGEAAGKFMSVFKRFVEQPLELLLTLH
jgi:pyruvate dehydrogenase E2 component (dihydrolipoamide acetyltransferase)